MRSDAFRRAAESKDFAAAPQLFREDVTFNSPVVFKPYQGREALMTILGAVLQVFEDLRYTSQLESGDRAVLGFSTRVGERELQGVDILRFDEAGAIAELTVMVRPMSAMLALAERMKAMLEAAGGG